MKYLIALLITLLSSIYAQTITGEALIREKIALPTDTVFTATLQDVSRMDTSAIVLGKTIISSPKSPIQFSIDFDESKIDPRNTYNVRATIHQGSKLLYTTDTRNSVLTGGKGNTVSMILKKIPTAVAKPELPASFSGTLPSASGEGIEYHLNLLPTKIFYLTTNYVGKPEGQNRFDDIGTYSTNNKTLTLKGGKEAPLFFEMTSRNTLRKLDIYGKPIVSSLNYDLKRDTTFIPVAPRLLLNGMYTYMADTGIFQECSSSQTFSVAQQHDSLQLERTYLDAQQKNNAHTLMAIVEGEIQQRPNMEGNLSTLIVHKFIRFEPKGKCKN